MYQIYLQIRASDLLKEHSESVVADLLCAQYKVPRSKAMEAVVAVLIEREAKTFVKKELRKLRAVGRTRP